MGLSSSGFAARSWRAAALSTLLGCGGGDGEQGADATGASEMTMGTTPGTSSTAAPMTDVTDGSASTEPVDTSTTASDRGWEVVLEADETLGALFSVWGPDADRVYAVGGQQGEGGLSTGTMLVRDAGAWTPAALPADTPKLNWIHGRDALRVVVGERGAILTRDGDDDATPWTLTGCATVLPLWGAWVVADDDVWAVGGDGFDRPPVLCHYDGAGWTNVELPALSVDAKALFKVFAVAADDVWAVGDLGLLIHYDGATWSQVEVDTPSDLISLWGTGPDDILAVGGRASGALVRRDANGWGVTSLAETPGLNGVWMDAVGDAHVVGIGGTIASVAAGSTALELEPVATMLTLHAVWSPGDGTFIAVGGSLELPPPFVGIIVEKN